MFLSDAPLPRALARYLYQAVLVAIAWVVLFGLNDLLFADLALSSHISWIFLPAAIRILSVLVLGWPGVIGLFAGAIVTADFHSLEQFRLELLPAIFSAVGPWCAITLCTKWLGLPDDLSGLKPIQLVLFALVGSLFNVIPHNIYFYLTASRQDPFTGLVPMFVGDLGGSFIVLYAAGLILRVAIPLLRGVLTQRSI